MSLKKLSGCLKLTLIAALLGGFLTISSGCESHKCGKCGHTEKHGCCDKKEMKESK
jgi:hypothetical protein